MRKRWLYLLITILACVTLWGCGSGGGGSDVTPAPDVSDAENVGNCTICHDTMVHTGLDGVAGAQQDWIDDVAVASDNYLGIDITHDCEACHGGGQFHRGVGPIPYPDPNGERCAECHTQATLVMAGKHGGEGEDPDMLATSYNHDYCQRCHTAEGAREFIDLIGVKSDFDNGTDDEADDAIVPAGVTPTNGGVEELAYEDADGNPLLHLPTCAACHNPLTKQLVTETADWPAGWDPNGAGSDQLALCTSCHNYRTNAGTLYGSGSANNPTGVATAEFYHDTAWYRTIPSTHYDFPETPDFIEGYVIRETSDDPCFDCHGHELLTNTRYGEDPEELTIHTQWAQSGHGGELLKEVFDAVEAVDCTGSPTLSHGRCEEQADAAMSAGSDHEQFNHGGWNTSCQRCHTSTGYANFADDPDTYDPTTNDWSHFASAAQDGDQNEMIYCWACHTDAETGQLRNPGAITEEYDPAVIVSYPDIDGSNVCMGCHLGRETGDVIKATVDADGVRNFINSHYFSAGGQLFAETGYEYDGQDYGNVTYFEHGAIGTADEPGTGENGPCIACHMTAEASHFFQPVEKDEITGDITAITSPVCIECHDGGHGAAFVAKGGAAADVQAAADFLNDEAEEYEAALEALAAAIETLGFYYVPSQYPYFHTIPNPVDSSTGFTNWAAAYGIPEWQNVMGAAFNLNLLGHDPGGYAHNRYYAKALIWDSIDYIYDGTINNSVVADIQALETATDISAAVSTAAQTYLGTSRPGTGQR